MLIGTLVGTLSAIIFYFLILPSLMKMKGDFILSFDSCSKRKKKEIEGIDNPLQIELEVEETVEEKESETFVDMAEVMWQPYMYNFN